MRRQASTSVASEIRACASRCNRVSLSFKLDRTSRVTLVDQLADGIRQAILGGEYRPGDVLPTLQTIASELGVSVRIPREALEKLTKEGLINPRQRLGSVVLGRGASVWRGRVLMVLSGEDIAAYHETILTAELRRHMYASGYLFESFALSRNPNSNAWSRRDAIVLDMLLRRSLDLCVVLYDDSRLFRLLAERGIPYIAVFSRKRRLHGCRSLVRNDTSHALSDLVGVCRAAGVESVVQFDFGDHGGFDAVPTLSEAGFRAERVVFPPKEGMRLLDGIRRGAHAGMREYLWKNRSRLPGVFLFADDWVANGALLALTEAGVQVPQEVRIVSFANTGASPLYTKSVAAIESNPYVSAESLAECVLAAMRGDVPREIFLKGISYVSGETFPV